MTKRFFLALLLGVISFSVPGAPAGPPGTELPPPSTGGLTALDSLLQKLTTRRRLLVIGAHPDDEDTPLLTLVSRGMGGEAAYLSLSRGDGGQNLIGDDLGVGLGLIRTEELNAARRIDGARQYFTRAYDFGFSKSLEETLRFWPKEALLEDAVRIIRRFRPQVVVSIFSGTSRDGHGQHQAAGVVAREAFHRAGDPSAFPQLAREGLFPWQPTALYQATRFLDREKTTIVLPTGGLEPLTGRSYQQIAVASRSIHRSQGTGALQPIGGNETRLGWLEGGAGKPAKDLFDGIDARLSALAAAASSPTQRREMESRLARAESLAKVVRQRVTAPELSSAVAPLASILDELRAARELVSTDSAEGANAAATIEEKISAAEAAVACAAGLTMDALAETETVTPGEAVPVTIQFWNAGGQPVTVESAALESPAGWTVPAAAAGKPVGAGALVDWKLAATLPADTVPTVPYFLRQPLQGGLYDWSLAPHAVRGEPFAPPPLSAVVTLAIGTARIRLSREATFRYRDEEFGEMRHPVRAVPKVEVLVEPDLIVWPTAKGNGPASVSVTVTSNSREPVSGRIDAVLPPALKAPPHSFSLARKGDRAVIDLALSPTGEVRGWRFEVPIWAELSTGSRFGGAIRIIDYGHIRPTPMPRASTVSISALDLKLPKLASVGYVRGASDRVPEALMAVGMPVHLLAARELEHGDLSRYDAIVIGPRAYETEPALANANARLLDYVRTGGLLIVQYQQVGFSESGFAPEKLEIKRPIDRVTDETAPVKVLEPGHPIFTRPNRIEAGDWDGFVQERGLYFAHSWAPAYTPLLAMADPGEPEQKGSLLVAQIGKGRYIYTGLAFFRQLPAGVAGAYRLFANLLAWRASAPRRPLS